MLFLDFEDANDAFVIKMWANNKLEKSDVMFFADDSAKYRRELELEFDATDTFFV